MFILHLTRPRWVPAQVGLKGVMLTIQKRNARALEFYTAKCKYTMDDISPSKARARGCTHPPLSGLARCMQRTFTRSRAPASDRVPTPRCGPAVGPVRRGGRVRLRNLLQSVGRGGPPGAAAARGGGAAGKRGGAGRGQQARERGAHDVLLARPRADVGRWSGSSS